MHIEKPRPGSSDRRAVSFPDRGAAAVTVMGDVPRLLRELGQRARRLPPPSSRNPHAFHEARDELGQDLATLADMLELLQRGPARVKL